MAEQNISCPNCGSSLDIDDVLSDQAEKRVRKEMQEKMASQYEELNKKTKELENQEKQMADFKAKEREHFNERLEKELKKNLSEKGEALKKQLIQESDAKNAEQIKTLNQFLEEERTKNKELGVAKIELLKMQQQLKTQKEQSAYETEKKLLEAKESIELEARKKENDKWELKEKELLKKTGGSKETDRRNGQKTRTRQHAIAR